MLVDKLSEDHWNYINGILEQDGVSLYERNRIGYHYRTAFRHGFKHAQEEEASKGIK